MKQCPNCHDANSCGDYEGPTCEICKGSGHVPDDWDDIEEGFDAGEWNNVPDDPVSGAVKPNG